MKFEKWTAILAGAGLVAFQGLPPTRAAHQPEPKPDQAVAAAGQCLAEIDRLAAGVGRLKHVHQARRHFAAPVW